MEQDIQMARLLEIHESLREAARLWGIDADWDEQEAGKLREEAVLLNHSRYLKHIPAYRTLAEEVGLAGEGTRVESIKEELMSTDDIFKSYDPAWVDNAEWHRMTAWLRKIFHSEIPGDFTDVRTLQDWLVRLRESEVQLIYSSGTTGNYSFVPRDPITWQSLLNNGAYTVLSAVYHKKLDIQEFDAALLTFRSANMGIQLVGMELAKVVPNAYFLYDMEMPADAVRIIQRGPSNEEEEKMISRFRDVLVTQRQERNREFLDQLRQSARQGRKVFLFGAPYQLKELCDEVAGSERVELPRESHLLFGGGWKSFEGERIEKPELLARIEASFGVPPENVLEGYSMTEMNALMLCCGQERFHIPPFLEPLIFDEGLVPLQGDEGTGIFGFLDPFALSYPGFIITGDQVTLRKGACPCGKKGYALEGGIQRAPGREVKGCGGIMASVRA